MARRARGSKNVVNFKGVEAKVLIPAGDYAVKVAEVSREKGSEYDYFKWVFEITDGKFKGKKLYTNTSLNPAALWNLANLLTALGIEVPDGELEIDLAEMVDQECNVVVDEDEYNGKPQSRVVDYYPADGERDSDDSDEDEDEDEKPKKGSKSKAKSKKDDDDEDEDEEEEDEKPARGRRGAKSKPKDEEEDEEEDEDEEEEEKPAKRGRGRPAKGKKPADDDEDEEDDEEEEEKVKTKGKAKKGKLKPVDAETLEEMDEDELGEVIETYDLDVDLDDYKTMKKKIAAVKEALEEKDMLTE